MGSLRKSNNSAITPAGDAHDDHPQLREVKPRPSRHPNVVAASANRRTMAAAVYGSAADHTRLVWAAS